MDARDRIGSGLREHDRGQSVESLREDGLEDPRRGDQRAPSPAAEPGERGQIWSLVHELQVQDPEGAGTAGRDRYERVRRAWRGEDDEVELALTFNIAAHRVCINPPHCTVKQPCPNVHAALTPLQVGTYARRARRRNGVPITDRFVPL